MGFSSIFNLIFKSKSKSNREKKNKLNEFYIDNSKPPKNKEEEIKKDEKEELEGLLDNEIEILKILSLSNQFLLKVLAEAFNNKKMKLDTILKNESYKLSSDQFIELYNVFTDKNEFYSYIFKYNFYLHIDTLDDNSNDNFYRCVKIITDFEFDYSNKKHLQYIENLINSIIKFIKTESNSNNYTYYGCFHVKYLNYNNDIDKTQNLCLTKDNKAEPFFDLSNITNYKLLNFMEENYQFLQFNLLNTPIEFKSVLLTCKKKNRYFKFNYVFYIICIYIKYQYKESNFKDFLKFLNYVQKYKKFGNNVFDIEYESITFLDIKMKENNVYNLLNIYSKLKKPYILEIIKNIHDNDSNITTL